MKQFDIPQFYRSPVISSIKNYRKNKDPRKKDFSPTVLDFGPVRFFIARYFGFCYGVENAIEISYKAVQENPGRRIYLLSEMIHNPEVNNDLLSRGVRFLMDTQGKQLISWHQLTKDDIVIIPAFGTTVEIEQKLDKMGIEVHMYNTTCPFVEKVWKRSAKLGEDDYTVVIHGKHKHEETRATFSHSRKYARSMIIKDLDEAKLLGEIILGEKPIEEFFTLFENRYSSGFDPAIHLDRVGVVNQTTMLATETKSIADYLKDVMIRKYGENNYKEHFADTRDTLCYATNDNQEATYTLLKQNADLAVVVGGYNSSNTSHIVELCEQKLPTYFISSAKKILSESLITHFDFHNQVEKHTENYLPAKVPVDIILTSGASCPDSMVDDVLQRLLSFFSNTKSIDEVVEEAIAG